MTSSIISSLTDSVHAAALPDVDFVDNMKTSQEYPQSSARRKPTNHLQDML